MTEAEEIALLTAERDELYAALEAAVTVFGFDLKRMVEFGPDYNQAVKDAFDLCVAALAKPRWRYYTRFRLVF